MDKIVAKLVELILGEQKHRKQIEFFDYKSFAFLLVISILLSELFWDIKGCIRNLINEQLQYLIIEILRIGAHLFTSLSVLSLGIFLMIVIIRKIVIKYSSDREWKDNLHRLQRGTISRCLGSLENIMLLLLIGRILDNNFISEYSSVYPHYLCVMLSYTFVFIFIFSRLKDIVDSFFVMWTPDEMLKNTEEKTGERRHGNEWRQSN